MTKTIEELTPHEITAIEVAGRVAKKDKVRNALPEGKSVEVDFTVHFKGYVATGMNGNPPGNSKPKHVELLAVILEGVSAQTRTKIMDHLKEVYTAAYASDESPSIDKNILQLAEVTIDKITDKRPEPKKGNVTGAVACILTKRAS